MQRTVIDERYAIVGSLGHGGMAQVYLVRDEVLNREVALKVLKPQYAESAGFVERFRREAENAAALSHPNILPVYDRGEDKDGTAYMTMEYVGGGTLADRLAKDGPLDALEAAGIAAQVAQALEKAHRCGVVHRDIKPHNIFLVEYGAPSPKVGTGGTSPGSVKVGDFGIALTAAETAVTETSLILGTVRYVSPEQATGEEVGPPSDLYSLGIVLFQTLTGRVPFDAENPIATAMKHVSEPPPSPREINPGVPEGLAAITLKLLSKDPQKRYANAAELASDLERASRGLPPARLVMEEDTQVLDRGETAPRGGVSRPQKRRRVGGLWIATTRIGGMTGLLAVVAGAVVLSLVIAAGGTNNLYEILGLRGTAPVQGAAAPVLSAIEAPDLTVVVPDVVGKKQGEAEEALREGGFEVEAKRAESTEGETGVVISQEPRSDAEAKRGSVVTITVGEGPATVTVPDLTGLSAAEAGDVLRESGLELGEQSQAQSATMPAGLILYQDVRAGTGVTKGTPVGVTVSLGPPQQPELQQPAPTLKRPLLPRLRKSLPLPHRLPE
jgi:hypothetical protein